jgi:hypothetical protein
MLEFFVINLLLVWIFWVLVVLFKGVITLWSVRRAGLEFLVTMIGRTLALLLFLLAFVVIGATITVVGTLPLVVFTIICLAMSATAAIACVMLFCITINFFLVLLLERVLKLAFCVILDLMLTILCKGTFGYLQVVDILEVFRGRFECPVAKTSSAFNILCAILGVERHIKPQVVVPCWAVAFLLLGELLPCKSSP